MVEGALSYKVTPGSKRSCDDVSGLADESFGRHMSWPLWIWVRPVGDAAVQILAAGGLKSTLIHPRAWKKISAKSDFRITEF